MKFMNLKRWMITLLSLSILVTACDDENTVYFPKNFTEGVLITNEGAYGAGNGSVSFYSFDKDNFLFNQSLFITNLHLLL